MVGRLQIRKKNISGKDGSIENSGRFDFHREQNLR